MDNKAIRRANVAALVKHFGGPTEFGKVVERDQVQVSQWLGGKPIGDRLTRHIEKMVGLATGGLDQLLGDIGKAGVEASIQAYDVPSQPPRPNFEIVADAVFLVQTYVEIRGEGPELISNAALIESAYDVVLEEAHSVSESNVVDLVKRLSRRVKETGGVHGGEQATAAGAGRNLGARGGSNAP